MPVEDGSDVQLDCLERTCDGKYKCSYCSYANKGMTRLIEHIRTHTGKRSPAKSSRSLCSSAKWLSPTVTVVGSTRMCVQNIGFVLHFDIVGKTKHKFVTLKFPEASPMCQKSKSYLNVEHFFCHLYINNNQIFSCIYEGNKSELHIKTCCLHPVELRLHIYCYS